MPDRLSPLDSSFLYLEESTTAMHVGSVMVFGTPDGGFDHDALLALVGTRVLCGRRYRQRVRSVPAGLGGPVWVDDDDFDLSYHVRRAALPAPGGTRQLAEFAARTQGRLLDRRRPLWEVYLVEGLGADRFAIVTKTHQALVDGVHGLDLGQLLLDEAPAPVQTPADDWSADPAPSDLELLTRAAVATLTSPTRLVDGVRGGLEDLRHTGGRLAEVVQQAAGAVVRTAASPAPTSPLNTPIGASRRVELVDLDLADFQAVRRRRFGSADHAQVTVNDVVLATVTGALREWLLLRGEPVRPTTTVRAMVPLSVSSAPGAAVDGGGPVGGPLMACFVDLPVGEPNPGMRLQQVSYRMGRQLAHGQAVGAAGLAGLAGFAPPTLHSMAARLASAMSRRVFNLVVSNVPGPQQPRFAGPARLLASYPVIPLARGQALSIGLTSYDGCVHLGLNGDREAMHDLPLLAGGLATALEELGEEPG